MHKKKVNQFQNGSILSHILSKVTEILEQQCNTLESQTTVNLENHINPLILEPGSPSSHIIPSNT